MQLKLLDPEYRAYIAGVNAQEASKRENDAAAQRFMSMLRQPHEWTNAAADRATAAQHPEWGIKPEDVQSALTRQYDMERGTEVSKEIEGYRKVIDSADSSPEDALIAAQEMNTRIAQAQAAGLMVTGQPMDPKLAARAAASHVGYQRLQVAQQQLIATVERTNASIAATNARLRIAQQNADSRAAAGLRASANQALSTAGRNLTSLRSQSDSIAARISSLQQAWTKVPQTVPGRMSGSHVKNANYDADRGYIHDQIVKLQQQKQAIDWQVTQTQTSINTLSSTLSGGIQVAPGYNDIPPEIAKINPAQFKDKTISTPDGRRIHSDGKHWVVLPPTGQ